MVRSCSVQAPSIKIYMYSSGKRGVCKRSVVRQKRSVSRVGRLPPFPSKPRRRASNLYSLPPSHGGRDRRPAITTYPLPSCALDPSSRAFLLPLLPGHPRHLPHYSYAEAAKSTCLNPLPRRPLICLGRGLQSPRCPVAPGVDVNPVQAPVAPPSCRRCEEMRVFAACFDSSQQSVHIQSKSPVAASGDLLSRRCIA